MYTYRNLKYKFHGTGIANCSSFPELYIKFDLTIDNPDPANPNKYVWEMSNTTVTATDTSGTFGYGIYVRIGFNTPDAPSRDHSDLWAISKKEEEPGEAQPGWISRFYIYNRGDLSINSDYNFTTSSSTVRLKIYVDNQRTCKHNGAYCFNGTDGYCTRVAYEDLTLPNFTVSYNANGGQGAPASQTKTAGVDLTITSSTPSYPLTITYYNNPTQTVSIQRSFSGWNTKADGSGTTYLPGATYSTDANCTLYAMWGNATFTILNIPNDEYVLLNYDSKGGSAVPTSHLTKAKLGYATTSGGAVAYAQGASVSTSSSMKLYPVYGNASISASSLPTATRAGYGFRGWYRDSACTNKVTGTLTISTDTTIYAGWGQLAIKRFGNDLSWGGKGQYAWRMAEENGVKVWKQDAPIFYFDGTRWVNLSAGETPNIQQ